MISTSSLMWSILLVVILVVGTNHEAMARSADGLVRIEKLLSSSSSSSSAAASPSAGLSNLARGHALNKRAILDQSCKGIYDRELFKKLDRVCDDCYNLYRKPYVGVECRRTCFGTQVFKHCVSDLLLNYKEYMDTREYIASF